MQPTAIRVTNTIDKLAKEEFGELAPDVQRYFTVKCDEENHRRRTEAHDEALRLMGRDPHHIERDRLRIQALEQHVELLMKRNHELETALKKQSSVLVSMTDERGASGIQ